MIPVSYDGNAINDGTNYESLIELDGYGLPLIDVVTARRQGVWPLVSGIKRDEKRISLQVFIRGASVDTLRKQLFQYFDYEDETPKKFIVEDSGGGNDRYVMAICRGVFPDEIMPKTCYHVALVLDGDVRLRETTATTPSDWNITATGQTNAYTNNGQDDCYPILKIKPTSNKTGDSPYRIFMAVRWRTSAFSNYPMDIANDSLDTQIASTNFALANGDDLLVSVDGSEVDRWLDGPDTATTKVWVNLDFQASVDMTLASGIGAADTSITVNESIVNMPSSGILYIDSEVITYTSKNNASKTFSNCSRGAKGSTAATHTTSTIVYWLQHDIWILYGNAAAGAPSLDDDYKPMFRLDTSTNLSWDYDEFNEDIGTPEIWKPRTGRWVYWLFYDGHIHTGTQDTSADPATVIGLSSDALAGQGQYYVDNPCEITNANFQTGWKKADLPYQFRFEIFSGSTDREYDIPDPSGTGWESWSRNETIDAGKTRVGLWMRFNEEFNKSFWCEAGDVTLTLNSSKTPTIVIGGEQGNYSLDCVITNQDTGESLELAFTMSLNDELELDTDEKTVIYLDDNSNQFQALALTGGPRRDWLALIPGSNTLRFDDVGTNAVTISAEWEERHYQ